MLLYISYSIIFSCFIKYEVCILVIICSMSYAHISSYFKLHTSVFLLMMIKHILCLLPIKKQYLMRHLLSKRGTIKLVKVLYLTHFLKQTLVLKIVVLRVDF